MNLKNPAQNCFLFRDMMSIFLLRSKKCIAILVKFYRIGITIQTTTSGFSMPPMVVCSYRFGSPWGWNNMKWMVGPMARGHFAGVEMQHSGNGCEILPHAGQQFVRGGGFVRVRPKNDNV